MSHQLNGVGAARDAVANKNTIYHRHLERRPEWIIIYYFYLLICHNFTDNYLECAEWRLPPRMDNYI